MSPRAPYPRPRPPASRAPARQPPPAHAGTRIIAYLVDVALVLAHVAASRLWRPSVVLAALVAAEVVVVLIIARAATGRSPGTLLTGTAAVRAGTDAAPGLRRAAVRGLLLTLLSATGVGGIITLALGRDGRDWVDRVAGTAEVNLRAKTPWSGLANLPGAEADDGEPTLVSPALSWQGPAAPSAISAPVERLPEQPAPARPGEQPAEIADSAALPAIEDHPRPATPPVENHPRPAPAALAVSESPTLMAPASSSDWDRPQPRAFDETPAPPARYRSVARHRASAPIPPAEPAPASSSPATPAIPRPEPPALAIPRPEPPAPEIPAAPLAKSRSRSADLPAAAVWIVLDSGEREPVDAVLVLGRAPTSSDPSHRLVTVTDPTRSLSRTHLRLGPAGRGGVWAEDMFSSNGTVLRLADGTTRYLPRGERVELDLGSALVIGERTLTIA